jgi:hypothetical protein
MPKGRSGALPAMMLLALMVTSGSGLSFGTTLDFDAFADSTSVTSQYAGVTFSNAIVLAAGIGLNELEFPPHSGNNVASDFSGPLGIAFNSPQTIISGYFTYAQPLLLTAFDASNNLLGSVSSSRSCVSNLAMSGTAGCSPNEFIELAGIESFSSVTITGSRFGGSFTMDDLIFSAVPEPSSSSMFAVGILIFYVARRVICGCQADRVR